MYARFWKNIIKNPTYSRHPRRRCVEALLRRHKPGTFYELLRHLDNPVWLRDKDIDKVDWVVGSIPVVTDALQAIASDSRRENPEG
jgi:hypothetical protein